MKVIEKLADALGIFSPILILLFACTSYLSYPEKENFFPDEQVIKEVKQGHPDEKASRGDVLQSLQLNKTLNPGRSIY